MKAFIALIIFTVTLAASLPHIHAWERANGYPFGKLCEAFGTCPAQ